MLCVYPDMAWKLLLKRIWFTWRLIHTVSICLLFSVSPLHPSSSLSVGVCTSCLQCLATFCLEYRSNSIPKNYNNKEEFQRTKWCLYFGIWFLEAMLSLSSYNKIWAFMQTLSLNATHMIFILKAILPHVCISHERLKCVFKCSVVWSLQ